MNEWVQILSFILLFAPIITLLAYYCRQTDILDRLEKQGVNTLGILTMKILRESFYGTSGGGISMNTPPMRRLDVNFKYTDQQGTPHILRVENAKLDDAYALHEGHELEILYLPQNPQVAYPVILLSMRRKQLLHLLLAGSGVYFFIILRLYFT